MTEIDGIAMAIDGSAMSGPSMASLRRPRRDGAHPGTDPGKSVRRTVE